jgi:hypothetical protein
MAKPFQFRLRTLLLSVVPVAVLALPLGYLVRSSARAVAVTGIMTLDGLPLDGAVVTFRSLDTRERVASGETDMAGQFRLITFLGDGVYFNKVYAGSYAVTVSKMGDFPKQFGHEKTSALTAEVRGDAANVFTFNLTTP